VVAGLLRLNYTLYRGYRQAVFRRDLTSRAGPPLLVYSIGKVGSTAISSALGSALPDRPVVHVHHMAKANLVELDEHYRRRYAQTKHIDSVYVRGRVVAAMLRRGELPYPVDVVTLTRDPLTRNASAFFQTLPQHFPHLADRLRATPDDPAVHQETVRASEQAAWMGDPFHWFIDELEAVTGFDAFAHEFDRAAGYAIYRTSHVNLLVLRTEDLTVSLSTALRQFLDLPAVDLRRAKEGKDAYYAAAYLHVKREATLPTSTLDRLYSSPLARHFYSDEELSAFRSAWVRPGREQA
jgi:hypothetical protein